MFETPYKIKFRKSRKGYRLPQGTPPAHLKPGWPVYVCSSGGNWIRLQRPGYDLLPYRYSNNPPTVSAHDLQNPV